jgi:DNA-binding XRE family transcriptional regulator
MDRFEVRKAVPRSPGDTLREPRRRLNLSQADLAELVGAANMGW